MNADARKPQKAWGLIVRTRRSQWVVVSSIRLTRTEAAKAFWKDYDGHPKALENAKAAFASGEYRIGKVDVRVVDER